MYPAVNLGVGAPHIRDVFYRMGLSDKDIVALSGAHTLVTLYMLVPISEIACSVYMKLNIFGWLLWYREGGIQRDQVLKALGPGNL